jgi:hypothetical protein
LGKQIVVCASTTSRSSCLQQSTSKQQQPRAKHKMPQTSQWPVPNPVFFIFILFIFSIVVDPSSAMTTPAHNSKLHLKADSAQYFVWIIVLEAC